MAATNDNPNTSKSKKRKQRYLPHNKPVKKKGSYPLHPGIRGFFITCDGGRERQASRDAIYLIDSFYEELIQGKDTETKQLDESVNKPLNKKIKFVYSDDEEDDDGDDDEEEEEEEEKVKEKTEEDVKEEQEEGNGDDNSNACQSSDANNGIQTNDEGLNGACVDNSSQGNQAEDKGDTKPGDESGEPLAKKPCQETCLSTTSDRKVEEKSIDKLIDDELKELGDKSKKLFVNLDAGCNGVAIVQMRKTDEGPSPKDIIHHIMTSAASTRKHMSRFILRILPVEVACYASEEEISRAMTMIVENYFPANAQEPQKFAVLYEARANTGIDRMKIINAVAKSVPAPHKVDLSNPEKTIVVEIVKTVCLIGVVEKYKEWAKYNLRQLTSSKH